MPFLHFFDGFRTSHEVSKIEPLGPDDIRAMIDDRWIAAHRQRSLSPDRPGPPRLGPESRRLLPGPRGDQPVLPRPPGDRADARWTGSPGSPAGRTGCSTTSGRRMPSGSSSSSARRPGRSRRRSRPSWPAARRSGVLKVRLFRPFDAAAFLAALPPSTRAIAVLDRTKEPGALGEPLYQDVVTAIAEDWHARGPDSAALPRVIGGRYGLASKEFTPAMAAAVFDELAAARAEAALHRRHRRRRHAPEPEGRPVVLHRGRRRPPRGLLRARQRRHGRRQQELGEDRRREHAAVRPGLLRLRLQEVGLDDRLAPAVQPAADPLLVPDPPGQLRGLPPVGLPRADRRARHRRCPGRRSC